MPFAGYEDFEDCVRKNQDKADPEAYCAAIKRQAEGDRRISYDAAPALDKTSIIEDSDKYLVMPAVIASEIVHRYEDGWAYKPAEELEKMAATAADIGSVPVKILEHPGADTGFLLLRHSDVYGRAENFRFVKNLIDPKTQRPCRRGVIADLRWFKNRVPASVIDQIKTGALRDVSIGFTFNADYSSGEWNGMKYDYIQRDIFLDHVAAPIAEGRCPGPYCGISVDSRHSIRFDAAVLQRCPVCKRIADVGLEAAGKRLWEAYGVEVLDVIEGIGKPLAADVKEKVEVAAQKIDSLHLEVERVAKELNRLLRERKC